MSIITHETLNPQLVEMQYAVRGPIVVRATEIKERLMNGAKDLPFDDIVFCNIGNPHAVGQKPVTYYRQILALCEHPWLLDQEATKQLFPVDTIERARRIIEAAKPGGTGAYSNSMGLTSARQAVTRFIQRRDGFPARLEDIFLVNGASEGIRMILTSIIRKKTDGIMCPVPQYPIYSALLTLLNGTRVDYFLDEEKEWALDMDELRRSLNEARSNGVDVRALVIINPGNPTGAILPVENMNEIVDFCKQERILLLADEVYQENIYREGASFTSFKKVVRSKGPEFDNFEMVSFHSTSKGLLGECGHRGGYMEMIGIDPEVHKEIYKLASSQLCPNLVGQILVELMVEPPNESDESYALWKEERQAIWNSLARRSKMLTEALNGMEGASCVSPDGAMYAFPRISLPAKAIAAAKEAGSHPDAFYCLSLLDHAGICTVPGSGFGQREGTFHFRTTFLPPEDVLEKAIERMKRHHEDFLNKYRD